MGLSSYLRYLWGGSEEEEEDPERIEMPSINKTTTTSFQNPSEQQLEAFVEQVRVWKEEGSQRQGRMLELSAPAAVAAEKREAEIWSRSILTKIYHMTFDDIIGNQDLKDAMQERVLNLYLHPELFRDNGIHPTGLFCLYGPPGTGKSLCYKALSGVLRSWELPIHIPFFVVLPSVLEDKYHGETQKKVSALFDMVAKVGPAVVVFEEVDALFAARDRGGNGGDSSHQSKTTSELLVHLEDSELPPGVIVICTTNNVWNVRISKLYNQFHIARPQTENN